MSKKTGVQLISIERKRQVINEKYDATHDESHRDGELAKAASCYATPEKCRLLRFYGTVVVPYHWPFHDSDWKPTPDNRIRELVKAGALIAAEIDRIQAE